MMNKKAWAAKVLAASKNFRPGDRVIFDGSGDRRHPRPYKGTVTSVTEEGLLHVLSDEWSADCLVSPLRCRDIEVGE